MEDGGRRSNKPTSSLLHLPSSIFVPYAPPMGFLQQPVQAKLSKLIGAEVRFDSLSMSLLGGSIEARG